MKKVNNLVVLGTIIATGIVTYKVTYKVLGKLLPNKENYIELNKKDNIIDFDEYKESELLDFENPRVERQYIMVR